MLCQRLGLKFLPSREQSAPGLVCTVTMDTKPFGRHGSCYGSILMTQSRRLRREREARGCSEGLLELPEIGFLTPPNHGGKVLEPVMWPRMAHPSCLHFRFLISREGVIIAHLKRP